MGPNLAQNGGQAMIRLGLIGDNIAASQAPRLHRLAGLQNDVAVTYDRLVPKDMGMGFDDLFTATAQAGYRGINITYPYKERAAAKVVIDDPLVRAIGAVNTVLFDDGGPHGFNTDYSGFVAAYRLVRGTQAPGPTLLIGAGGVGKAVAFGLIALGINDLRIAERDLAKADDLAASLVAACPGLGVRTGTDGATLATGAQGLINCTPVGMVGYGGTPLPRAATAGNSVGANWAFDAVYTPIDTTFLQDAAAQGLTIISGYELFIGQGVDAWQLFTGLPLDTARLRHDLAQAD